jgi:hypothetical protein
MAPARVCLANITICSNDVTQFICKIIFAPHTLAGAIHGDTRANRRWRNWEDSDDHPLWPGIVVAQAEIIYLRGGNASEDMQGHLWSNLPLLGLHTLAVFVLGNFPGSPKLQSSLANFWLSIPTTAVRSLQSFLGITIGLVIIHGHVAIADHLGFTESPDRIKSALRISNGNGSFVLWVTLRSSC